MIQVATLRDASPTAPRLRRGLHQDSMHMAIERTLDAEDVGLALPARLQRYRPFLAAEYEDEQRGLLSEALEHAPWLAGRVEGLRRAQREILAGLDELIALLGRAPAEAAVSRDARGALSRRMRWYRRDVESLLLDAYMLDLGGEGC